MSAPALTTEADLAERFGIGPEEAATLRQKQKWPHVRLSRFKVRYTDEQIEQIIAARSVSPTSRARSPP